jgi:hypothetical protein
MSLLPFNLVDLVFVKKDHERASVLILDFLGLFRSLFSLGSSTVVIIILD